MQVSSRKKKRLMAEINAVPYIDIMLVLLVIFMITAPLLSQGVQVNLPQAAAKPLPTKSLPPLIVTVDHDGLYYLNTHTPSDASISAATLSTNVSEALSKAQENHEKQDVYVKGDRDSNYGQVVHVMVLLQKAGAESVGLMTEDFAQ